MRYETEVGVPTCGGNAHVSANTGPVHGCAHAPFKTQLVDLSEQRPQSTQIHISLKVIARLPLSEQIVFVHFFVVVAVENRRLEPYRVAPLARPLAEAIRVRVKFAKQRSPHHREDRITMSVKAKCTR
tara:strand:+ start:25 stop:408 length:384 start_codon:yes stop_codon:yes gene_type:complete